jgi:hypothetical protein
MKHSSKQEVDWWWVLIIFVGLPLLLAALVKMNIP